MISQAFTGVKSGHNFPRTDQNPLHASDHISSIWAVIYVLVISLMSLICHETRSGIEKDVVILRKYHSADENLVSFLGKGIIPVEPEVVCNTLKNPHSR